MKHYTYRLGVGYQMACAKVSLLAERYANALLMVFGCALLVGELHHSDLQRAGISGDARCTLLPCTLPRFADGAAIGIYVNAIFALHGALRSPPVGQKVDHLRVRAPHIANLIYSGYSGDT